MLTNNDIVLKSCERLEKEYEDFKALKGTKTFQKILGIYKSTSKEEKENSTESISYNSKLQNAEYIADYLSEYVLNVLKDFCSKDVVFATQVLRFVGNFTGCIAYVIHGYISKKEKQRAAQLSDVETYTRAVEYYFSGTKIQCQMKLELPKEFNTSPITEEELKNIEENYNNLLDLARAEKLADEQKKAKEKAEKAAREAAKKLKEAKSKARKQAKEAKEKAKKAQGSLFTEDDYKVETPKPTPKPTSKPKPTVPAQENKVIQISLFDNLLGGAD